MKAAEEYLIRGRLSAPVPQQQQKKVRRDRKAYMAQIAGCTWVEKDAWKERTPRPMQLMERNINFSRQDGGQEKNKFKEQRHQGKLSGFLRLFQEKVAWRKGSRESEYWEQGRPVQSTAKSSLRVQGAEHKV